MAGTTNGGTPNTSAAAGSTEARSKFSVPDEAVLALLGSRDENLRTAEEVLTADVHVRGNEVTLSGEPSDVAFAERVFAELVTLARRGQQVDPATVRRTVAMLSSDAAESPAEVLSLDIISRRGRTIRPKTLNQKRYVDAIDEHTLVFGIGPAGTGKTYLAMAKAVQALQAKQVNRIILTRPAVEAGERLGFLPGTLYDKIDPYLRPLYDALHDMVDPESIPRLMQAGTIEVAPLAYMRGRAQPVDTKVLTPFGFRPIGDLRVGDLVVGSNGEPTPVLGVYPQGPKKTYRVHAQDGSSVLCSEDHLWTVRTAGDSWRVRQTKDMLGQRGIHELPMLTAPVAMPYRAVPTDPYGFGSSFAAGLPIGGGTALATSMRVYLDNCVEVRLSALQGLLDTGGAPATGHIEYRAPSTEIAVDVVALVQSLGGTATPRGHVLEIRLPQDIAPFRVVDKLGRYEGTDQPVRFIDRIEPAGVEEAVCIQVAAEDSLYVTEDYLLTHNTLNDAFIILDEAQNTTPEQMKMFLTRLGFGSKIVVTGDVTQVDLPGGHASGLRIVRDILQGVRDVHFAQLTSHDVVRHRLVGDIVDAYERWQATLDESEVQVGRAGQGRRGR
ncbi:phosphate starvation-inducible PhoH-like protein [Labedaea rhizosphaerae]|uniref:PhoH-like protein n=1 Tax=Labedaea rhizosphaerae TaxID=598644 RepID=A0A4R6S8T6_LABRH|nr:phosphate starvation-inducible PhoH-like protein [Labedaea rhizosphaerae]